MNRYVFSCLLALFSLTLALPPATAQRRPAARPRPRPMLALVAFPAAFAPVAAPLPAARPVAPASLAPPDTALWQHTLRETRLSWQFIKRLFRYAP